MCFVSGTPMSAVGFVTDETGVAPALVGLSQVVKEIEPKETPQ